MPPNNTQSPAPGTLFPTPNVPQPAFNAVPPKKRINVLLLPLILVIFFLIVSLSFGFWAYLGREDYKNNSDKKSAAAVAAAEKTLDAKKEADFAQREKEPLKEYKGSATFGSLGIKYPKTWSAYVVENSGSTPIDGYMHPNIVPGVQSGTKFALRFQVTSNSYDSELKKFDTDAKSGKVTVAPVTAPKVAGVTGVRVEGAIANDKVGTVLLFPLRDKTLKITTESTDFSSDLNNIILPNLTFVP